jgi:cytoskeletal protein RodZ
VPDIGNTLREARIRRGLSITEVETVTKIRSKYLEALEENDFEVLPGPTVVKGFLRSYAVFLKLDPERVLTEYRSQFEYHRDEIGALRTEMAQQRRSPTSAERKKKRTRRAQRGYVAAGIVAVLLVILLAWLTSGGDHPPASIGVNNLPTTTPAAVSTTIAGATTTAGSATSTSAGDAQTATTALQTTSTAAGASQTSSTTAGVPTTTGANVKMVLTVIQGSCWLVVRQDNENGAELYAGTLSAGGQQTFDGAQRYWVMAGIPQSLSISVNGTPYSLSGAAGAFLVAETGVDRVNQQNQ